MKGILRFSLGKPVTEDHTKPSLLKCKEFSSRGDFLRHIGRNVFFDCMHAAKAIQGNARSTDLLMKLNQPSPEETDADLGRRLTAEDLTILSQLKNEIAAGNKTIDGSFPDEPTEYKEPTK